ncbi:MAG TPA: hypothetical protein VI588_02395 [Candidatus Gracilibacteria bacterium]|nr:hypothetical protein [Candidatus Gracilibacteria bacterium]
MNTKKGFMLIWISGWVSVLSFAQFSQAAIIFQNDDFHTLASDSVTINSDDEASGDFGIRFGQTLGETLNWNVSTSRFDLSDDLNISGSLEVAGNIDVNLNEMVEMRAENLSSAPTCNSGATGLIYQNTTDGNTYSCNGTTFLNLSSSSTHYENGSLTANVKTATITNETTDGATTSMFVTTDGTSGGTKLFTTVYHVSAEASEIESDSEAPSMAGYSYNSSTGELQIKFLESAGILLGGQGLEGEESGTAITVFIIGV